MCVLWHLGPGHGMQGRQEPLCRAAAPSRHRPSKRERAVRIPLWGLVVVLRPSAVQWVPLKGALQWGRAHRRQNTNEQNLQGMRCRIHLLAIKLFGQPKFQLIPLFCIRSNAFLC